METCVLTTSLPQKKTGVLLPFLHSSLSHRASSVKIWKNCGNTENYYVIDLVNTVMVSNSLLDSNEYHSPRCSYLPVNGTRWLARGEWVTTSIVPLQSLLDRLPETYKTETVAFTTSETLRHFAYSMCLFLLHLNCSTLIFNFVILDFVLLNHIQILFDLSTHF